MEAILDNNPPNIDILSSVCGGLTMNEAISCAAAAYSLLRQPAGPNAFATSIACAPLMGPVSSAIQSIGVDIYNAYNTKFGQADISPIGQSLRVSYNESIGGYELQSTAGWGMCLVDYSSYQ